MKPSGLFHTHDAIILAGGKGERLAAYLRGLPKPMVPVLGKPLLEWMIIRLRSAGFVNIILSVGYRREVITDYFKDGARWGARIRYVREDTPLGTGGALREALLKVETEHTLVMNGDSLCMCDIAAFYRFHLLHGGLATLCCVWSNDPSRFGTVGIEEDGRIREFREKRETAGGAYINAGIYWMQTSFGGRIVGGAPLSLEDQIFPSCPPGTLYAYREKADFLDVGTSESLKQAPDFLVRNGFLPADGPNPR
ncbi:MAG: nucleotidyltransferase family protein [Candidatus Aureabacteria bacterium]|nr:nucleotidyltransferase family protein [Candidatus Auribacterota bacterium]